MNNKESSMNTSKLDEQGAAVIDTTKQEWGVSVNPHVLEQQAKDALSYPDIMGEFA